ncbi:MAG TPA: DUF5069 domain-containing protein [Stenomitos sp.]
MALDLTKQVPRSPFERVDGFPWLLRLIDKARATFAGTLGDYTPYPGPGDRQFLWYFGLSARELGKLIQSGASEEEIVGYVQRHTKRTAAEKDALWRSYFEPPRNPIMRLAFGLYVARGVKRLKAAQPDLDPSRIKTLPQLLAAEEGHPLPTSP